MRSFIVFMLKLAGGIGAFALLFHFIDLDKVLATLRTANLALVCLGVLAFLAGQVVAAARWKRILRSNAINIPLRGVLRINLIGTFAGSFLPGMATGDLAKSALLFNKYPGQRSFLVASVVYDRIFGLAAVLILAIFGTSLLGFMRNEWIFAQYTVMVGLLFMVTVLVLASNVGLALMLRLLPKVLAARCLVFTSELQKLLCTRSLFWPTLGLSLGFQLSWAVSQWIMLDAINPNAPFAPILAASPLSLVVALLPVSINGLGLREGSFSYILQQFGIDPSLAVAAALLTLIPILTSSVIGGLLFVWGNRSLQTKISATMKEER